MMLITEFNKVTVISNFPCLIFVAILVELYVCLIPSHDIIQISADLTWPQGCFYWSETKKNPSSH